MIRPPRSLRRSALSLVVAAVLTTGIGWAAVIPTSTPVSAAACEGCMVLSAPTISLNVTAQPGKQAVIDQHNGVAIYTPLTNTTAGGLGTIWLVGHRTTHGAIFNQVPALQPGDPIDLVGDGGAFRYIVNRLLVVGEAGWQSQVDINDTSRSLLILQTSHPDRALRYLIEALGVGPVPVEAPPTTAATPAAAPVAAPAPVVAPPTRDSKFGAIKSTV